MRFVDQFRDKALVKGIIKEIHHLISRKWSIMEICGGQTHAIGEIDIGHHEFSVGKSAVAVVEIKHTGPGIAHQHQIRMTILIHIGKGRR